MARQPRAAAATAAGTARTRAAATGAVAIDRELIARQRTPLTSDLLSVAEGKAGQAFIDIREAGVSNLFRGMKEVHTSLSVLTTELADRLAPPQLIATLVQPDGSPAATVQVEFDPTSLGARGSPVTAVTGNDGAFQLALPPALRLPDGGKMALTIHGASVNVAVQLPFAQIASNGLAGQIALPQFVPHLPVSILASLLAVAPPPPEGTPSPPLDNNPQLPVVRVGDCDECLLQFGANKSIDKFPYGIFFRLIEPRASVTTAVRRFPVGDRTFGFLPYYLNGAAAATEQVSFVDRVPVDQPLSVDGFRDRLMGLQPNGTFTADETVPMAGTLGLGYVLWMSQRWTFQGLALGDLVYSLPLAPGEQQQVAIFERRDSSSVYESEFFDESQSLRQSATADTSTDATFSSAFNEVINGRSSFRTDSSTSSFGGSFFGLISGGSGSSSSSGTTASSLQGQRDTTQRASEATHSAAQSSASARRTASRTGMRVATASESQSVTTKTVTNHNHTRALTMQYWEVLRLYDVATAIDGLTLTVLVPLQVIRFMPPGATLTISSPTQVDTRLEVLIRYGAIIKHADVLARALPSRFRHGLQLLTQFAADPTASVEPAGGVAEDVIQFSLQGGFLPYDVVSVTAVTNRNTRIGPARLSANVQMPPLDTFSTREEFIAWMVGQRRSASQTLNGALALPPSLNRSSIIGFEVSRRFDSATYTLISKEQAEINALNALFPGQTNWITPAIQATFGSDTARAERTTLYIDPGALEREVGGPGVTLFEAAILELDAAGNDTGAPREQYAHDTLNGIELPLEPYPIPALQLGPVLRFKEILEIERMAQHVVRNTMQYSVSVWSSLTDVERAILLEGYTIGVPTGGIQDASQMVPLLNCVENRVLGFFGNSMILPFVIPQVLAQAGGDGQTIDPGQVQESLLAYQKASFKPPHSTIALPTRGVLGEAVLGRCSSAEKIDLTRFWNWQDSPADTAPTISPVTLPTGTPSLTAGVTAPNSLTNLPSLINNVLTAPSPDTSLLVALGANAAAQKDFDSKLTGSDALAGLLTNAQNVSNSARADALKTTKDLQALRLAIAGNILGGLYGKNPTAGSSAAAALNGQGSGSTPTPTPAASGDKSGPGAGGATGGGATGGGTTGGGTTGGGTTGGGTTGGGTTGGGTTGGGGGTTPAPVPGPAPIQPDPDQ